MYISLQYQAKGEGEAEGTTYFLPPGISMDDKDDVISSPTQNESNTSSAQQVNNNKEEDEDDGPWDCPSCGYTNTTSKARCTNILRDNTGDGRQDKCMAWREGKRKKYYKKVKDVLQRVLEKKNEAERIKAEAEADNQDHNHNLKLNKAAKFKLNKAAKDEIKRRKEKKKMRKEKKKMKRMKMKALTVKKQ